jgi:hypothetical protein
VPREKGLAELSLLGLDGNKPANLNDFLELLDITEVEFDSLIHKPVQPQLLRLIEDIENWLLGRNRV